MGSRTGAAGPAQVQGSPGSRTPAVLPGKVLGDPNLSWLPTPSELNIERAAALRVKEFETMSNQEGVPVPARRDALRASQGWDRGGQASAPENYCDSGVPGHTFPGV